MKYALRKDMPIDDEMLKKIKNEQELINAKQAAYNFVSYKPRTKKQITDKLKEKGFGEEAIASSLDFLSEFSLYDDRRFAKMFIKDFLQKKPSGKPRLIQELFKRGVPGSIIEEIIESFLPVKDNLSLARLVTEKKLRTTAYKSIEKQRSSLISYLQRQGFDWDTIKAILSEYFDNNKV